MAQQIKYSKDRVRRALYAVSVEHDALIVSGGDEPRDELLDAARTDGKELAQMR